MFQVSEEQLVGNWTGHMGPLGPHPHLLLQRETWLLFFWLLSCGMGVHIFFVLNPASSQKQKTSKTSHRRVLNPHLLLLTAPFVIAEVQKGVSPSPRPNSREKKNILMFNKEIYLSWQDSTYARVSSALTSYLLSVTWAAPCLFDEAGYRGTTEQKCVCAPVMTSFLACCSFIFDKLISDMNV